MAYISLNYHSPTIGMHQNLTVILPEDQSFFNNDITAKPLKTLMLLHGLSSDETTYMRYTSIERYANEHKLAVIMPMWIIAHMLTWHMVIAIMIIFWKYMIMFIKYFHFPKSVMTIL